MKGAIASGRKERALRRGPARGRSAWPVAVAVPLVLALGAARLTDAAAVGPAWARPEGTMGSAGAAGRAADRGEALFGGRLPLRGRIRAHEEDLPAAVVVCRNCHGSDGAAAARPSAPATASSAAPSAAASSWGAPPTLDGLLGPRLDRATLTEPRARRGGPPSAYDEASFCRLLGTGIDPAYVLVAREMPRYRIDEGDCLALWHYLTTRAGAPGTGADR